MKKIRVLIVDDSALMRQALKNILESVDLFEIAAEAIDGRDAIAKAKLLKPDVITMDLKMPFVSGLEAIEEIMENNPIPIIVVSSLDKDIIIKTLSMGAMDFVAVTQDIDQISKELIEKVKIASRIRPLRRMKFSYPVSHSKITSKKNVQKVIGIGVSTGGPQALQEIFMRLPADFPAGIIVVQHMSKGFIQGLVDWLNSCSHLEIKLACHGDILKSSTVLLAPDGCNITIDENARIILSQDATGKMSHVPSIDVMLNSIAKSFKENAVGVLLTGMGKDGVEGMRSIKHAGGIAIAQDEQSSIIFGMNKIAIDTGCVDKVVSLNKIPEELCELTGGVSWPKKS